MFPAVWHDIIFKNVQKAHLSMEFNEKLQQLRKQKGLTQEELAGMLYVSRTAVSKWESGRGYPSIDSLRAIAAFFSVSIDDLLSGDEVLNVAEEENKQREAKLRNLVFAFSDCGAALLFFLPIFRMTADNSVHTASLMALSAAAPYMRIAYFVGIILLVLSGIFAFIPWARSKMPLDSLKCRISLIANALVMLVFILGLQPYPAALLFVFFAIKALLLIKKR